MMVMSLVSTLYLTSVGILTIFVELIKTMANLSGKVNYVLLCIIFDHTVLALHFVFFIDIYFGDN